MRHQDILSALRTNLGTIQKVNGYRTDIGLYFSPYANMKFSEDSPYLLTIEWRDIVYIDDMPNSDHKEMSLIITCFSNENTDPIEIYADILQSFQKYIDTPIDPYTRFFGREIHTEYYSEGSDGNLTEVQIRCEYRTNLFEA